VCLIVFAREGEGARLTVALAGHPPPLLIDSAGAVREIGQAGTLLGVIDPVHIQTSEVRMASGETLLLYTDGVSEAGAPERPLGEHELRKLCAAAPRMTLPELLEYIESAALERTDGRLRDDVALLALRI
jgi:serine phosphatase RsbU (regulator of sigma subunit)